MIFFILIVKIPFNSTLKMRFLATSTNYLRPYVNLDSPAHGMISFSTVRQDCFRVVANCGVTYCEKRHTEEECNCDDQEHDEDGCDGHGRCREIEIVRELSGTITVDTIIDTVIAYLITHQVRHSDGSGTKNFNPHENLSEWKEDPTSRGTCYDNPVDIYMTHMAITAYIRKLANGKNEIPCKDILMPIVYSDYYGDETMITIDPSIWDDIVKTVVSQNYLEIENPGIKFLGNPMHAVLVQISIDEIVIRHPRHLEEVDPVTAPELRVFKRVNTRNNHRGSPWEGTRIMGVLDSNLDLLDGYHRYKAALDAGEKEVTVVIFMDHEVNINVDTTDVNNTDVNNTDVNNTDILKVAIETLRLNGLSTEEIRKMFESVL